MMNRVYNVISISLNLRYEVNYDNFQNGILILLNGNISVCVITNCMSDPHPSPLLWNLVHI